MDIITLSVLLLLRLFLIYLLYTNLRLAFSASLNTNFYELYVLALHVAYLSHFLF